MARAPPPRTRGSACQGSELGGEGDSGAVLGIRGGDGAGKALSKHTPTYSTLLRLLLLKMGSWRVGIARGLLGMQMLRLTPDLPKRNLLFNRTPGGGGRTSDGEALFSDAGKG